MFSKIERLNVKFDTMIMIFVIVLSVVSLPSHPLLACGVLVLGALVWRYMRITQARYDALQRDAATSSLDILQQEALQKRLAQLTRLEDLTRKIASALDSRQISRYLLDAALQNTGANYASLAVITEAQQAQLLVEYVADDVHGQFYTSRNMKRGGILQQVMHDGAMILCDDNRALPDYIPPPLPDSYRSVLAMPLIHDGAVIGVLSVESKATHAFNADDVGFLKSLIAHSVISIENARLLAEHQHQVKMLANLHVMSLRLSKVSDINGVSNAVLETALALFDGQAAIFFRYDDRNDEIRHVTSRHSDTRLPRYEMVTPMLMARETARTGEIQIVQHREIEMTDEFPYACLIAVPIKRGNRVSEILSMAFTEQRAFSKRDFDTLALLAGQVVGHIENARLSEQMRLILNTTRDGLVLLDDKGRLIETNLATHALLGDSFATYLATVSDMVLNVKQDSTRRQFEQKFDHGVVHIEEICTAVRENRGEISGWLLALRDVTEEHLLHNFRDEITSMVVHDLRGPLASIISGITLTLEELYANESVHLIEKTLMLTSDSALRLMALVESLLDISRLETREMQLHCVNSQIVPIVNDALATLSATAQQAHITLCVDIAETLPPVFVDMDIVRRVLVNLLDNALRFTPPHKQIVVKATQQGDALQIEVIDSGSGVPLEERLRIFEKFKQIRNKQFHYRQHGIGIGLTFCKLAIEAHGGRIWVENSDTLGGARFIFTLPVVSSIHQVH